MISGEDLAAYAAGAADPALVARVESAVADDPEVAARLDRLRTVDAVLGDLDAITMDDAESERLAAAVTADLTAIAAATDPDVVDLAARRHARATPATRSWWDPWRLAGAAAALVLVVAVGATVLTNTGGDDGAAETADMAAAPADDDAGTAAERTEEMVELPTSAEQAETAAAATEAATEAAGSDGEGASESVEVPVVDDQRVVAAIADVDPTALRDRLQPLVEMGALEDAPENLTAAVPDESSAPSAAVGIADGRVSSADREAVRACLPGPAADVIVAEVIVVAPERAALAYVLGDRVVVVDATSCALLGEFMD